MTARHFLDDPPPDPEITALFEGDISDMGYVMNLTRLWSQRPELVTGLFKLMAAATSAGELDFRQRGILVTAAASTLGDSYCSLAWGGRLAGQTEAETAAGVLSGDDSRLPAADRALAEWARKVVADPNQTTAEDVAKLRREGFTDRQIFAITVYLGLRIAFSTVNDALGVHPDHQLATGTPAEVVAAVGYGRPIADPD